MISGRDKSGSAKMPQSFAVSANLPFETENHEKQTRISNWRQEYDIQFLSYSNVR